MFDPSTIFHLEESPTLNLNRISKEREANGLKVYKFGFGESPFEPPQFVIDALSDNANLTHYSKVEGPRNLRQRISNFHNNANQLNLDPEQIIIGPGSKILIFSILRAIKSADVFLASPSWVSYRPQIEMCGHHLINIETTFEDRWRITLNNFKEALQKKQHKHSIIIINYPGNPDGLSYQEDEMSDLVQCFKDHNCVLISDEIYGLLNFNGNHQSFMSHYPECTIITSGLSKWCGAGGWRFGFAAFGSKLESLTNAVKGIGSETYSCVSSPVIAAAERAYQNFDEMKPYLNWQIAILQSLADYCYSELVAKGLICHPSVGGFYLFPDFENFREKLAKRGIINAVSLCKQLLDETGVALLPAQAFGMPPDSLQARLAYVDFKCSEELEAFSVATTAPQIKEGISKLNEWLTNL